MRIHFLAKKNAFAKARVDAWQILKRCGFDGFYDASSSSRAIRIARKLFAMPRLKEGQALLVQNPLSKMWLRYLSLFKAAKKIALARGPRGLREWKIYGGGAFINGKRGSSCPNA